MAETDLSDWLPVLDAAAAIGCSKRTLERRHQAWSIEQRLRRQEGTPPVAVYNPDDVHRIASERHQAPPPFVLGAVQPSGNGNGRNGRNISIDTSALARQPAADDPIHQFFAYVLHALQSPPSPPVAEKLAESLYLNLQQASARSGLSKTYLRRQIASGTLKAVRDRGWRIRRKDLEAL
jgi:hypothetical protein